VRSEFNLELLILLDTPAFARDDGEMGEDGGNLNAGYAWIQIIPIGIELFYQSDFPGPIPLLQLLLAPDRVFDVIELLKIDEPVDLVFLREPFTDFRRCSATRRITSFVTPI
jgi:hypothetical protein